MKILISTLEFLPHECMGSWFYSALSYKIKSFKIFKYRRTIKKVACALDISIKINLFSLEVNTLKTPKDVLFFILIRYLSLDINFWKYLKDKNNIDLSTIIYAELLRSCGSSTSLRQEWITNHPYQKVPFKWNITTRLKHHEKDLKKYAISSYG